MNEPTITPSPLEAFLKQSGRVASLEELQALVSQFESVLNKHGIAIRAGSQLERACLAVRKVYAKHQHPNLRTGHDDSRILFSDVLGIWSLFKMVVQFQHHPTFSQLAPHLELLNKGTVVQNTRLLISDEASNKIFELLFALVLLSVGTHLVLDHPLRAKGDNPDILVTIDGKRWGFALKTVLSPLPKSFFRNLRKGVRQIQVSEAEIGCVVVNFRNLIDHGLFMPLLNPNEHAAGAVPDFGAYEDVQTVTNLIARQVKSKEDEVRREIGEKNISRLFAGKKAIPGFAAFFQTRAIKITFAGTVPTDICSLGLAWFGDLKAHTPTFEKINLALHQRIISA